MKSVLLVAPAIVALLGGCSAHQAASEPASPARTASAEPSAVGESVTVSGRMTRGVEPGCLLLQGASERNWLLLGGDRSALTPGRRVTVQGVFRRDLMTTCQQGLPLLVRSVSAD